jgi:hypothetical protein
MGWNSWNCFEKDIEVNGVQCLMLVFDGDKSQGIGNIAAAEVLRSYIETS